MAAHGARTRTGRIQKDRIEQSALACNIDVCKRRIKITTITRRKFDSLGKTGLLQAQAIDFAFCRRKIYSNMAPAQPASIRTARHDIRLGTAPGTDLQT